MIEIELYELLLYCVAIIFVSVLTYYTISIYDVRKRYNHIPGPSENGIVKFYFGQIFDYIKRFKSGTMFSQIVQEEFEKYGPVIRSRFLNEMVVHTMDADAIKEIMITEDYEKDPKGYHRLGWPLNERFMGNSILTETDKNKWYARRTMFNHAFQRNVLQGFLDEFNAKGDLLIERLRSLADNKTPVTLLNEFNHAALDIIASIAFGMNIDSINDPENKLNKHLIDSFSGLNCSFTDPFINFKPHKWNDIKSYKNAMRELRKMAKEQILNRLELIRKDEVVPNDILSIALKNHASQNMDLELTIDDFVTFFVGGQETTANTLAFCFMELGRNRDILEKLKNEIESVLGTRTYVNYEDLTKLKYESAIIKEALRLYPPVPQLFRKTTKEMTIKGYKIPPNTIINASTFSTGRCDKYFKNPLSFKPERFLKDNDSEDYKITNYTYFPFGLGSRNCIGQNFAQIEAKVIITKLIQNFEFRLDLQQSFEPIQIATIKPKDGTRCFLKIREN